MVKLKTEIEKVIAEIYETKGFLNTIPPDFVIDRLHALFIQWAEKAIKSTEYQTAKEAIKGFKNEC